MLVVKFRRSLIDRGRGTRGPEETNFRAEIFFSKGVSDSRQQGKKKNKRKRGTTNDDADHARSAGTSCKEYCGNCFSALRPELELIEPSRGNLLTQVHFMLRTSVSVLFSRIPRNVTFFTDNTDHWSPLLSTSLARSSGNFVWRRAI